MMLLALLCCVPTWRGPGVRCSDSSSALEVTIVVLIFSKPKEAGSFFKVYLH